MRQPSLQVRVAAFAASFALTVGAGLVAGVATASPAAAWTSGVCQDGAGVTVVVDFQDIGGGTITRCADVTAGATGIDALKKAGFSATGTARFGMAFVCRINNRPGPEEALRIPGNEGYLENCQDTPQGAFWSYWVAPNGGSWSGSSYGALSRQVVIGGFEGWSFSMGGSSGANPVPRQAPSRPNGPSGGGGGAAPADGSGGGAGGGSGAGQGGGAAGSDGSDKGGSGARGSQGAQPDASNAPEDGVAPEPTELESPEEVAPEESATGSESTEATDAATVSVAGSGSGSSGIPMGTALGIGAVVLVASGAVTTVILRRRAAPGAAF